MASRDDLVTKLNAEVVGGNYIAGPIGNRVFVGKINEEGVFFITPEGEEMLADLQAPAEVVETPKATRKKAAAPLVEDDIVKDVE